MKARATPFKLTGSGLAACLIALGFGGCTTAQVAPPQPPSVTPPSYVQVPHPPGYDLADVRAIFMDAQAPRLDSLKDCDADLKKLKSLTRSREEIETGVRELVKQDPGKYHWCYYGKVLELEDDLKADSYLDERQKKVLDAYGFLTPVGRAFMLEFHDSRYLRWGVRHYRRLSEWVFYRRLEMTPQATSELVEASNPFALQREPASSMPVLEKYGLAKSREPANETPAAPPAEAPMAPGEAVPKPAPVPAERIEADAVSEASVTEMGNQMPPAPVGAGAEASQ